MKIGGNIVDNDSQIASYFNEFFINVGSSTENTVPKVPNISPSKFLKFNFVIAHVTNEEVLDIVNALDNKSSGPSSIHSSENAISDT